MQGLVKGAKLCFRYPYFYFGYGESTSTASQLTTQASQKSKDLNKVSLLLQDLGYYTIVEKYQTFRKNYCFQNVQVQGCQVLVSSNLDQELDMNSGKPNQGQIISSISN